MIYCVSITQVKRAIIEEAKRSKILAYITALKKLCNHPKVRRFYFILLLSLYSPLNPLTLAVILSCGEKSIIVISLFIYTTLFWSFPSSFHGLSCTHACLLTNDFVSCSLYMIPYEAGVQELLVLRIASGSSRRRCYREGTYFKFMSYLYILVSAFNNFLGKFSLDLAHGAEDMELGLSCREKCMSWQDYLPNYGRGPMTVLCLSQTTHRYRSKTKIVRLQIAILVRQCKLTGWRLCHGPFSYETTCFLEKPLLNYFLRLSGAVCKLMLARCKVKLVAKLNY